MKTIVVRNETHEQLGKMGCRGDTFDEILTSILKLVEKPTLQLKQGDAK